jgi:hypothetical protein
MGEGKNKIGVYGQSTDGTGVRGRSSTGIGVQGSVADPRGLAGHFKGAVVVDGDFTVTGVKGAVVAHPDGSRRLFCAIESPESWFEDFAEGSLEGGRAEIALDPDFAKLTKTDHYHVFLTAYGPSNGLYVEHRTARSFVVREQQDGKSHVSFSYRIVAKRRDIDVARFKKMPAPPDVQADVLGASETVDHDGAAAERQPHLEQAVTPSPRSERSTVPQTRKDADSQRARTSMAKPNVEDQTKNGR